MEALKNASLCSKVNLYISGRNLKNHNTFSKSNPVCEVYEKRDNEWVRIHRTEKHFDTLDPDFFNAVAMPYYFERH